MRGDFSRDSFNERAGFSGVLRLQGRVQLDADDNENQAILLHQLRTLAMDVIGKHGGPEGESMGVENPSTAHKLDFAITPGRYYVEGLLCENWERCTYRGIGDPALCQPWWRPPGPPETDTTYIAYLEVWERSLSAVENDPSRPLATPGALREVALGGADSAARRQLLWRIRLGSTEGGPATTPKQNDRASGGDPIWAKWFDFWHGKPRGRMRAQITEQPAGDSDPCVISPRAAYRGLENQLSRIEICRGGPANHDPNDRADGATFVWSRNNAGTAFAV